MGFSGMDPRAITREVLENSFHDMKYNINLLKSLSHLPGPDEFIS